jgi:molybdopterin molybdotransferase
MKEFFKVADLEAVFSYAGEFSPVSRERVPVAEAAGRVLFEDLVCDSDIPAFRRATMDGFAVCAASTFGASEANPAYLTVKGSVAMGQIPTVTIGAGDAAKIATGGMLPDGSDGVVMIEYTEALDSRTVEVYRSISPGQHVIEAGEDFKQGERVLEAGRLLRPADVGLLAALGHVSVNVFRRPRVAIISTGDEIVPIDCVPAPGQIRDINSYTLSSLAEHAGAEAVRLGIVADQFDTLHRTCADAINDSDMVLVSGGSSVGVRDLTIDVLSALPQTRVLVHGISISPGKPTILARVGGKAFWGLPGHVVSAMIVFSAIVKPFLEQVSGKRHATAPPKLRARIARNIASAQGRVDFVRVRLRQVDGELWADPVLGKSGLINTMVTADGLVAF